MTGTTEDPRVAAALSLARTGARACAHLASEVRALLELEGVTAEDRLSLIAYLLEQYEGDQSQESRS
jgi:hypothetical protein